MEAKQCKTCNAVKPMSEFRSLRVRLENRKLSQTVHCLTCRGRFCKSAQNEDSQRESHYSMYSSDDEYSSDEESSEEVVVLVVSESLSSDDESSESDFIVQDDEVDSEEDYESSSESSEFIDQDEEIDSDEDYTPTRSVLKPTSIHIRSTQHE